MLAPILTKISNVIQGGIKKSKYNKNTSEINELERDLSPVKFSSKSVEKQNNYQAVSIKRPPLLSAPPSIQILRIKK
tara:strand:- start:237 stop:467 length:231 start_codon:yes stop_codon:yes gene_type:complete